VILGGLCGAPFLDSPRVWEFPAIFPANLLLILTFFVTLWF
jgi:hypothetical protein